MSAVKDCLVVLIYVLTLLEVMPVHVRMDTNLAMMTTVVLTLMNVNGRMEAVNKFVKTLMVAILVLVSLDTHWIVIVTTVQVLSLECHVIKYIISHDSCCRYQ